MSPAQERDFMEFWAAYPRKVGRLAARQEWARLHPSLADVLAALAWQRWDDPQFIPHPRTWLHQGRWMDEPTTAARDEAWWQECDRIHETRCGSCAWHEAVKSRQRGVA